MVVLPVERPTEFGTTSWVMQFTLMPSSSPFEHFLTMHD